MKIMEFEKGKWKGKGKEEGDRGSERVRGKGRRDVRMNLVAI